MPRGMELAELEKLHRHAMASRYAAPDQSPGSLIVRALKVLPLGIYLMRAIRPCVGNFWNCSASCPGITRSTEPAIRIMRA
jgi:hypothetical protein